MKVIDLFAGAGGLSLGFKQAGYEIIGFVENNKDAIKTHKKNFPKSKLIGEDITQISDSQIKEYEADIIVGGIPCQGFSMCGKRSKKDPRNLLYKEYLRFVKIIKPKLILIENVPGLASMNLDKNNILFLIINELIKLGYCTSYKVLNSAKYGVPQVRKRLFLIGIKKNLFPVSYRTEFKSVLETIMDLDYREINGNIPFEMTKETLERIMKLKPGELLDNYNFGRMRLFGSKPCPTVATKKRYIHPIYDRFLTPRELARLQSFPDSFYFFGSKTSMLRQIGNAVPPLLAKSLALHIREVIK